MTFIVDYSYGHATMTAAAMRRIGAAGGIAYAGCNDGGKNITKSELQANLDAGFLMGLVIENNASDLAGGRSVGVGQGHAILTAAKALGYDYADCVLFTGYDTDAHQGDMPALLAAMEGFASVVPNPGYYGDSDSIDYLAARHPSWRYWQSESGSFSPEHPSPHATLWQQYNDPRAHGLPVDVNNVLKTPIGLMGEQMPLTDADAALVARKVWNVDAVPAPPPVDPNNPNWYPGSYLGGLYVRLVDTQEAVDELAAKVAAADDSKDIAALSAKVDALTKLVSQIQVAAAPTPAQIAAQLQVTAKSQ